MSRAYAPILILLYLAFTCVGCRLIETASWPSFAPDSLTPSDESPAPKSPNTPLVALGLNSDSWQLNPAWSPILEARSQVDGTPSAAQLRWRRARIIEDKKPLPLPEVPAIVDSSESEEREPDTSSSDNPAAFKPPWVATTAKPSLVDASGDQSDEISRYKQLIKRNDLVGWNAAILSAHAAPAFDRKLSERLEKLVGGHRWLESAASDDPEKDRSKELLPTDNDQPSIRLRAAAAEAWCLLLAKSPEKDAEAMQPVLENMTRPRLPDEVRTELMRGIARRLPPRDIPWLKDALSLIGNGDGPPPEYRLAAIEACLMYSLLHPSNVTEASTNETTLEPAGSPFPEEVANLRWDDASPIRIRFGQFLALTSHPDALMILKEQTLDTDFLVRDAALLTLGELKTPEAKEVLLRFASRPEVPVRVSTLKGLSAWGPPALIGMSDDSAQAVRIQVAKELGRHHTTTSAVTMRDFLNDQDLQVQLEAIKAIEPWPNHLAVPLLLHALRDGSLKARQLGLRQLEQRRGGTIGFPIAEAREIRVAESGRLAREWRLPSDISQKLEQVSLQDRERGDELRLAEIQEHLRQLDSGRTPSELMLHIEWLKQLGASDLPVLEKWLDQSTPQQAEILLEEVLPRLSVRYESLLQLADRNPTVRQRAALNLVREAEQASLTPQQVRQLRLRLIHEQDRLVWRYSMTAILNDNSEETAQIALLALNHLWPDIRVLGCEHISHHARPVHANWLLPLFSDANGNVQIAAIRAAAKCHNPVILDGAPGSTGGGLRPLLVSERVSLRLAAAACMSRFGDESALRELTRLSLDENWSTRRDAVEGMGASGQTRFIEQLIRVAWTEPHQTVRYMAIASLNHLVPAEERPAATENVHNLDDLVKSWAEWWEIKKRQGQFATPTQTYSTTGVATENTR